MQQEIKIYHPKNEFDKLFIKEIWRVKRKNGAGIKEKVLPKGFVEVIFNYSDTLTYAKDGAVEKMVLPRCYVSGINFKPITTTHSESQYLFGITFHVFALKYIFKIPICELNDRIISGDLICNSLDGFYQRIFEADIFEDQVAQVRMWLQNKMDCTLFLPGKKSRISRINEDRNLINLSVKQLSDKYGLSTRQLRRLTNEYFGMCTEDYILYKKYLLSLKELHQKRSSLTEIGYTCGFYDQAHFTRTFKLFTNTTPTEYLKSTHPRDYILIVP